MPDGPGAEDSVSVSAVTGATFSSLSEKSGGLADARIEETALCWLIDVRWYALRASRDRWPVRSWMIFSGTWALNILVAPVTRRL